MGLVVVTSHRLEELFEALAESFVHSPLPALAKETVLVPGRGLARWLELRFAERQGIAAGLETPFFGSFLDRLAAEHDETAGRFGRDVLAWRVHRLLAPRSRIADRDPLAAPLAYCQDDPDGLKRWQLARRIALRFDDYQLYRDDLLLAFAGGDDRRALSEHAPWQAALWRALLGDAGIPPPRTERRSRARRSTAVDATPTLFGELSGSHAPPPDPAHRLARLRQRVGDADWCRKNLPPRLSVFGATTMPPAFVDVLHRLARHVPVTLYVPHPTPHYTGDIRGRSARSGDNALLHLLGAESREFAGLLLDLEETADDRVALVRHALDVDAGDQAGGAPMPETLLACLQTDIVRAFDRAAPGAERFPLGRDDASFLVHDCHSPQRELEVVRDQILRSFADDPSLEPRDVLVLVPDIDRYAPYAHAVFGPLQQHLPFLVADRSPARELPVCRATLAVLGLVRARLTLGEVLHVLENEAVQRRFGLCAADVPTLRHLCQQAGVRWGIDAASRSRRFDVPPFDENAWQQGLDRLVLGTLTGDTDALVFDVLPVGGATGAHAERVARFASFARALFTTVEQVAEPRPLAAWADRLEALVATLFEPAADDEAAVQKLADAAVAIRHQAMLAAHEEPVSPSAFRSWLEETLAEGAAARGFLGGAVTIAAMLPMRAVPVRQLYVCGLDDESFPRRDRPEPFDLVAAERRPGDRSRRLDDRQLFLDLLLAARDRMHLTFVGRNAKDNAPCAPSVVLAELLEHVDRTCAPPPATGSARDAVVVQHPLQPWSRRYADADDPRLFTYARLPAPGTVRRPPPFCPATTPVAAEPLAGPAEEAETLPLEALLEFWWHPTRQFLRQTLGVRTPRDDGDDGDENEPFALSALDVYKLHEAALRRAARADDGPTDPLAHARALGVLPVGEQGHAAFRACADETEQLLARARSHHATGRRPVDLVVAGVRLVGEIDGVGTQHLVRMRPAKCKPKDHLRGFLLHLVAAAQSAADEARGLPPWPRTTRILARDAVLEILPVPAATALELLAWYVVHRRIGLERPLDWFERASHAFARRSNKDGDLDAALKAARREFVHAEPQPGTFARGDLDDADVALCTRDRDPFADGTDSEFCRLARQGWEFALGVTHEVEVER